MLYPDGVDSPLAAPQLPSALTLDEVGGDREVWLYPGTAVNPAHAAWHDRDGPAGPTQWTWSGRPATAPVPTSATFNGAAVPVTAVPGGVTLTITGDGTLELAGGGTLTIARGLPAAQVTVRLRS